MLHELQNSNCDRRLIETVESLQTALSGEGNIVHLGITAIGCDAMRETFSCELPEAIQALLKGFTTSVSMYVAQFPDWQKFAENAAKVELQSDQIQRLITTAERLSSDLTANPDIADPAVPRTILAIRALIQDPANTSKRAAFALLRTLENLIAKAFEYGGDFLDKTIRKTSDCASTVIAGALAVALLTAALEGATGLSPLAATIKDVAWIKTAAELVKQQLEKPKP